MCPLRTIWWTGASSSASRGLLAQPGANNATARTASLLAVAAIPVAAGLGGDVFTRLSAFDHGLGLQ